MIIVLMMVGLLMFVGVLLFLTTLVEAYKKCINERIDALAGRTTLLEGKAESLEEISVNRKEWYDFINNRPCSEDEAQGGVIELWLYGREKDDIRQILCFRPAYLINDEGKTIERF